MAHAISLGIVGVLELRVMSGPKPHVHREEIFSFFGISLLDSLVLYGFLVIASLLMGPVYEISRGRVDTLSQTWCGRFLNNRSRLSVFCNNFKMEATILLLLKTSFFFLFNLNHTANM